MARKGNHYRRSETGWEDDIASNADERQRQEGARMEL